MTITQKQFGSLGLLRT